MPAPQDYQQPYCTARGWQIVVREKVTVAPHRGCDFIPHEFLERVLKRGVVSRRAGEKKGDSRVGGAITRSNWDIVTLTSKRGAVKPWRRPKRRLSISVSRKIGSCRQRLRAAVR